MNFTHLDGLSSCLLPRVFGELRDQGQALVGIEGLAVQLAKQRSQLGHHGLVVDDVAAYGVFLEGDVSEQIVGEAQQGWIPPWNAPERSPSAVCQECRRNAGRGSTSRC
jgi:hypothetical protein